jgi:hypothetical protein
MWCKHALEELDKGKETVVRPRGQSMRPKIVSGARVTLRPPLNYSPSKGDIVLAKVKGTWYLHLITAVEGARVQIGNNRGHINGWTNTDKIAGVVSKVDNDLN